MSSFRTLVCLIAFVVAAGAAGPSASWAQPGPRFGVGAQLTGSTIEENVGLGLRFRVSAPVNRDLSFAVGSSFIGYVFEGQDEASYAIDPQASIIVTLPVMGDRSTYFLGGLGVYVPFDDEVDRDSAPTFHFGVGKVWLLQDSSLFLEFDPAIAIGEDRTELLLPLRVGVIF